MVQMLQQNTLDNWAKKSRLILRLVAADRNVERVRKGYFTLASAAKGKTPKQLETLLGFNSGTFKNGVHVFVAKASQLSLSNVDFKGYTNTIGGICRTKMTEEQWKEARKNYKPGTGVVQINVTKPISVKNFTAKKPLGYNEKISF